MGYSSYLCKSCGHSIASNDCLGFDSNGRPKTPHWLMACVLLTENATLRGSYDGFGNVLTEEGLVCKIHDLGQPLLLHQDCWIKEGRLGFDAFEGGSAHDPHQGNPPQAVWNLPSPLTHDQHRWTQIAKFGLRRYFRDEITGGISQVGDSGSTPDESEEGILRVDTSKDRPVTWNKYGQIPMIDDTKEECIPHCGFENYNWELVWMSPGPSSTAARVFLDRSKDDGELRHAVCDSSGNRPDTTNDGVLWIDRSRTLRLGNYGFTVPVVSDEGSEYTARVCYQTAAFIADNLDMQIVSECGKYRITIVKG